MIRLGGDRLRLTLTHHTGLTLNSLFFLHETGKKKIRQTEGMITEFQQSHSIYSAIFQQLI